MSEVFIFSSLITIAAVAGIVGGSIGLTGGMSLKSMSIVTLVTMTPISVLAQLPTGILGLTGLATLKAVSAVTLSFSIISFMISSSLCCANAENFSCDRLISDLDDLFG